MKLSQLGNGLDRASSFAFAGTVLWFIARAQGFKLLSRSGELCVRFLSVPFARCGTSGWLTALDIAIWACACALAVAAVWVVKQRTARPAGQRLPE